THYLATSCRLWPALSRHLTISVRLSVLFFFNDTATTEIYTLSLHDALPISHTHTHTFKHTVKERGKLFEGTRSEEHTSELQSHLNLVCRLLLEKKQRAQ